MRYVKARNFELDQDKRLYTKGDDMELPFNPESLKEWVKAKNKRIKEIIELRRQGSELYDFA